MMPPDSKPLPEEIRRRLLQVRLLGLDVDGVMTDGRLYYGPDGTEFKAFNAQDGSAMKRLMASGVTIAVISGRKSEALDRRAAELGVPHLYAGVDDKLTALEDLAVRSRIDVRHMAYVGDDIGDLALFDRVGVAFSVRDAHPEVVRRADYVTSTGGGFGAVREICDLFLALRG